MRWLVVLGIAAIGALEFELVLPWTWKFWDTYWDQQRFHYQPLFAEIVVGAATVILAFALMEPIRVRDRQWVRVLWYPINVGCGGDCLGACRMDGAPSPALPAVRRPTQLAARFSDSADDSCVAVRGRVAAMAVEMAYDVPGGSC